jgi:hypothetical protein
MARKLVSMFPESDVDQELSAHIRSARKALQKAADLCSYMQRQEDVDRGSVRRTQRDIQAVIQRISSIRSTVRGYDMSDPDLQDDSVTAGRDKK